MRRLSGLTSSVSRDLTARLSAGSAATRLVELRRWKRSRICGSWDTKMEANDRRVIIAVSWNMACSVAIGPRDRRSAGIHNRPLLSDTEDRARNRHANVARRLDVQRH